MNSAVSQVSRIAPSIGRAQVALAALFALIVLAPGISAPFQKDAEPQSAEWIQSIVHDGHWLIPHDDYGEIDRKPPLFYWLAAAAAGVTGGFVDETRARVVSLAAAVVLAVGVLTWTAANLGARPGWLAFLLMLGTYGFASRATTALTDMLLTMLLLAAYCAVYPVFSPPLLSPFVSSLPSPITSQSISPSATPAPPGRIVLVGLLLGLAVLTKGPVAIVLCALAAMIYLFFELRSPLSIIRERWPWIVLAIALAIGAVWYVPVVIFGKERILRIIFAENFGHFMPVKLGGTGESYRPFYFIFARLLGGAFPMTLLVAPAIIALFSGELAAEKRPAVIYQTSMTLAVLIFFSIASVKRDDYILPALPGIAILCGSLFALSSDPSRGIAAKIRDTIAAGFTVGCAILMLTAFAVASIRPDALSGIRLQSSDAAFAAIFMRDLASFRLPFVACAIVLIAAAILALTSRGNASRCGLAFASTSLALSMLWTSTMRPELAASRSLKFFTPQITQAIKGATLCIPTGLNYELSYYWGAKVPALRDPQCIASTPGKPVYLVATPRELAAMPPAARARLHPILKSELIGGGGPPSLYEITPSESPDLKAGAGADK